MNYPQQGFGNQGFQQPMQQTQGFQQPVQNFNGQQGFNQAPQQQYQAPVQQQAQTVVQQPQQDDGTKIVIQGRVVWGQFGPTNKKVYGTNQDAIDPKTGKPIIEYVFGLAVPKIGPQSSENEKANFSTLWTALTAEAGKMGVQWGNTGFAWKCFDADTEKREDGTDYPSYYKGCFIVTCSTRIPILLHAWEQGNPKPVQVTEKDIKAGDYVQVALTIACHKPPNPGLYINPTMVCRFAFGEAIVAQRDASKVFAAPPPIPQGGSATPIGTAPQANFGGSMTGQPQGFNQQQPMQGMPGQWNSQQGQPVNVAPVNQFAQQAPTTQQVQPNFGVLPQQMQQPAQQQWQTNQAMQGQGQPSGFQGQPYTGQGY